MFQHATHVLEEWRAVQVIRSCINNQSNTTHARSTSIEDDHWKKSAPDRYKYNIDVAFSTSLNRVGLGMCLRDDDGAFVLART